MKYSYNVLVNKSGEKVNFFTASLQFTSMEYSYNGVRLCRPIALSPQVTSPQPKLRRPNIEVVSPQHWNGENLYKFQALTSQATCFSKARRCTSYVVWV